MSERRAARAAVFGAVAAIAGVVADASIVTCAWFAAFGAAFGVLLAAGPVVAWLVIGALLVPAAWGDPAATAAASALLLCAHLRIARPTSERFLTPVVAVVAPLGAVRLVWPTPTGSTAVLAATLLLVAAALGLRRLEPGVRRALVVSGSVVGTMSLAAALGGIVTGLAELRRLDRAVDAVDAGLDATRAGDAERGAALLADAAETFHDVRGAFDAPWAAPARVIPILGRQLEATSALVGAAERLATVGADVAGSIDTDELRPIDGRIDLDAIAALEVPLRRVQTNLDAVVAELHALRSPWLVTPLSDALDDFDTRARGAERDAASALAALEVAPTLLGRDGERRWFVAIVTPAQTRGAGGYMGSFGILRVDDGRIELEHLGRHDELSVPTGPVGPTEYVDRYWANFGLDRFAGNLTASPHFPSVAAALAAKYATITGVAVDGAIAIDPDAFVALLQLVGPVSVEGWREPLGPENARRVLLHEQYVELSDDTEQRVDFLEAVARVVFDRIVDGGLPKPVDVGAAMSPLLPGRHVQLWSADAREQAWFDQIGATGALAPVRDDVLAVVQNNASRSKIDWYLRREISYDVDAIGEAELVVRFHNDAPASGPPAYVIGPAIDGAPAAGVNRVFVGVFTARTPTAVTVDGESVVYSMATEQGRNVAETFVEVAPGGVAELRVRLAGPPPVADYRLDLDGQAMVNADRVRVTVDGEVLFDGPQIADLVLRRR